ncbi:MAG: hypothetical protein AAB897_03120 [Patescibacteria group bacterium]
MSSRKRTASRGKKRSAIRAFVQEQRKGFEIKLTGPLPELSCFEHGEFRNLLWRQMMTTPESRWYELKDAKILNGVYREVLRQRKITREALRKPEGAA